ncbi:hypothetical protein E2C01_047083 [Portunus trituberculatus]|uniref:Uncharacterized protein n=1 Tax=Portunus trituberculatus TaxID=210409 RepID=A0A5B7G6Z9_PORTR|nr:hypothetical protein [Portunus trituberculatus]
MKTWHGTEGINLESFVGSLSCLFAFPLPLHVNESSSIDNSGSGVAEEKGTVETSYLSEGSLAAVNQITEEDKVFPGGLGEEEEEEEEKERVPR